ncbi:hypothetical protein CN900_24615 [Bacillus anthracis]|uniref:hypothetical protein n=1 Tax=Bacillus tropicus TaxID=2026188 RepID=UPI000BFE5016|nr:hypothetical protein [Bacillus tropicus]PGH86695.1 hypothetical protein CN900_24615 [Bacillus anthracis]PGV30950.1 hypothetical protein COD75_26410 [Bacillus anthracis]
MDNKELFIHKISKFNDDNNQESCIEGVTIQNSKYYIWQIDNFSKETIQVNEYRSKKLIRNLPNEDMLNQIETFVIEQRIRYLLKPDDDVNEAIQILCEQFNKTVNMPSFEIGGREELFRINWDGEQLQFQINRELEDNQVVKLSEQLEEVGIKLKRIENLETPTLLAFGMNFFDEVSKIAVNVSKITNVVISLQKIFSKIKEIASAIRRSRRWSKVRKLEKIRDELQENLNIEKRVKELTKEIFQLEEELKQLDIADRQELFAPEKHGEIINTLEGSNLKEEPRVIVAAQEVLNQD